MVHGYLFQNFGHPISLFNMEQAKSSACVVFIRACNASTIKLSKDRLSRPYHENDNARAEERNRYRVRKLVGKDRFGEQGCVRLLNVV